MTATTANAANPPSAAPRRLSLAYILLALSVLLASLALSAFIADRVLASSIDPESMTVVSNVPIRCENGTIAFKPDGDAHLLVSWSYSRTYSRFAMHDRVVITSLVVDNHGHNHPANTTPTVGDVAEMNTVIAGIAQSEVLAAFHVTRPDNAVDISGVPLTWEQPPPPYR